MSAPRSGLRGVSSRRTAAERPAPSNRASPLAIGGVTLRRPSRGSPAHGAQVHRRQPHRFAGVERNAGESVCRRGGSPLGETAGLLVPEPTEHFARRPAVLGYSWRPASAATSRGSAHAHGGYSFSEATAERMTRTTTSGCDSITTCGGGDLGDRRAGVLGHRSHMQRADTSTSSHTETVRDVCACISNCRDSGVRSDRRSRS